LAVEQLRQSGDVEDALCVTRDIAQCDCRIPGLRFLRYRYERSEPGRVDERQCREVDHDRARSAVESAAEAVNVDCATCHRGVAVPKPLRDLMLEAAVRQGPDAASKLYRDLRAKYYGSQSYDFSEQTLLSVADRLAQSRPDVAVAVADLNIEFYPKSWRSYLARGIAQSRRLDTTPDAVASFRKALEIDPDNGVVQGWLAQTEPVAGRVR